MTAVTACVVELNPEPTEVAIVHLPAGSVARFQILGQDREQGALYEDGPLIMTFAGVELGWGCRVCLYGSLPRLRNSRHALDRPWWQGAVKVLKSHGIAYLGFAQEEYFGKARWMATSLRFETAPTHRDTLNGEDVAR